MLFARVPLFPTCSAILSVAFDLNFPPASCFFDKIDDCLIYLIKASNVSFVRVRAFCFKSLILWSLAKIKEIVEHGIL